MTKPNKDDISKVMSELGQRSAKRLTKKQRVERGKAAAKARWEKNKPQEESE